MLFFSLDLLIYANIHLQMQFKQTMSYLIIHSWIIGKCHVVRLTENHDIYEWLIHDISKRNTLQYILKT